MYSCLLSTLFFSPVLWLLALVQDSCSAQKAAGPVVLESPDLPVMEGDDVTLLCRSSMSSFNRTADFYKDDVLIRSSETGNITIHNVSRSDEGLYRCSISGAGESAESRLTVRAGPVILESPVHPVTEGESVTLRCRKRNTPINHIADFYRYSFRIGTGYKGDLIIPSVSKSDEGLYKCSISGSGESAESRLTVRGVPVVLESPGLPVMEGEAVTLRCVNKISTNVTADFYKNSLFFERSSTGNITIPSVSKSDEGLYRCSISGAGESAESRLTVRECPNQAMTLCSDQLPVFLYLLIRTVFWVVLLVFVLRKCHCEKQRCLIWTERH
ncbi:low affinity immunoglobulin gamma Fc region receptor III [Lates calcarifer]|uniref:low affinity immunoglobulin gamma Fc region receptor III n=1 Tax=Lates calcarifer TaxID=8187 RepID=UPI0021D7C933|nr:low affinity immunoglobulin gamma Fc region receptor III [Lates calcarifer]